MSGISVHKQQSGGTRHHRQVMQPDPLCSWVRYPNTEMQDCNIHRTPIVGCGSKIQQQRAFEARTQRIKTDKNAAHTEA